MPWENATVNQLVIQGTNAGMFIYNGTPGLGTLIGSWASTAGTDPYGNPYPAGINVTQGALSRVSITTAAIMASTISQSLLTASTISSSNITGGTMNQTVITFNSTGGGLFLYTTTTNTTTYNTPGLYFYTAPPASVASMNVQCWGGDAGAGGGSTSQGGEGGGGAEYAQEPAYANYNPSGTYPVTVGNGGYGGNTFNAGTDGQLSSFDNYVIAGGGYAGSNFTGGQGGNISTNTIHYPGGNGGSPAGFTSSGGGGGRAGSTGAGGNGTNATANGSPGFGGSAGTGTGGIVGSNGVVAQTNGNSGNAGGSGAGEAGAGTTYQNIYYDPTSTASYYGAGVGGGLRGTNGSMFQGDPNVPTNQYPGDQESFANYNNGKMQSDWSGWTVDQVTLTIQNQHSWYNSGCYVIVGYGTGTNHPNQQSFWCNQGANSGAKDVSATFKSLIQGTNFALMLGPSSSTSGGSLDLWNYGYFQGNAGAGGPRLTVNGHKGTGGIQTAGNGGNGAVIITYQTTNVIVGALSPVAGTDAGSNTYGVGYTGQVQAFTPGSSPATTEVWHSLTPLLTNSWVVRTGGYYAQYRMSADNMIEISGEVTHASISGTSQLATALPSGYWPAENHDGICYATATTSGAAALYLNTSGVLTLFNLPAGTVTVAFSCRYPKNGSGSP